MKQIYRLAIIPALCLLSYSSTKTHAQQTPPRFVAATHERYDGASFRPLSDSVRIRWHDTCGAGFDYFTYAYGSIPDYFDANLTDTLGVSPRAYLERQLQPFDTMYNYAPLPGGTGWSATPTSRRTQGVNNRNTPDSSLTTENGTGVSREEFFYDASGKWVTSNRYIPTSTGFVLRYTESFVYDNNGNLIAQKLMDLEGAPFLRRIISYTYDSNNQQVQINDSFRTNGSIPFVILGRVSFVNNVSGQRMSALSQTASGTAGVLVNTLMEDYTFNSNNRLKTRTYKEWSGTAWDTVHRFAYTYGSPAGKLNTVYILLGPSMDTAAKTQWYYNSNNLCDSAILQNRTGPGLWLNYRKTAYIYNNFGQITHINSKSGWNAATHTWDYRDKDVRGFFYYESTDPTKVKDKTSALDFSVYPNPVHREELHIRSGGEVIRQVSVYDISGKLLIREKVNNPATAVTFDLRTLAAGTYILYINGEQAKGSTKIVVR